MKQSQCNRGRKDIEQRAYPLLLFIITLTEYQRGGSDGDDVALMDGHTVLIAQDGVHVEGTGIARGITEYILQFATLVALYTDDAVLGIYTWIYGLYGRIDVRALHLATYHIVAHAQRDDLLVVETVLHHHDTALCLLILILIEHFLLACGLELADTHTDGKLLMALLALEDELLTLDVLCLVEGDVMVTFGTTYAFHQIFITQVEPSSLSMLCR